MTGLLKQSTEPKLRLEDLSLSPSLLLPSLFPRYVDNTKIAETVSIYIVILLYHCLFSYPDN